MVGKIGSLLLLRTLLVAGDGLPENASGGIARFVDTVGILPLFAITLGSVAAGIGILLREAER